MEVFRSLAPSIVRQIVLEEHAQIRAKMSNLEMLLASKNEEMIVKFSRELFYYFIKHIEHEEQILRPVLKDIDSWGDVRVSRMNKEHQEQRKLLTDMELLLTQNNFAEFNQKLRDFLSDLKIDMEQEEADCLNPDVLKDDPITVGTYTG